MGPVSGSAFVSSSFAGTTPELEATYVRARNVVITMIHDGQPLARMMATGSWGVLQRLHRMQPELYAAPISLYHDYLRNRTTVAQPLDRAERLFPWIPKLRPMHQDCC